MDNHERMLAGKVYDPSDAGIMAEQAEALELLYDFNASRPSQQAERAELLRQMFAEIGDGCYVEPPLHANWGGRHVYVGSNVYANSNLTLVDDGDIHIGDNVMFGPNVVITTAGHPILPELRARGLQFNLPVHIGRNVWVGSGVQIMPGVTIGDDSVIGAGSVVTRDIPAGVVAVGIPCRVVREIGEHDREFYWRDRRLDV
ncbi:sugar O-acetyltransferase [Agromyces atrinae]|uniref:Acetyltransferase n=2 Tax=Agromyces atrinae TaxID=592376 RepID=A0A852S4W0_9MICO|nr:sugar O-acetyltransferase [Agromyces atrinae]NYD67462.1 galactoside O-acetyltransferase [Agromyces atrinae]